MFKRAGACRWLGVAGPVSKETEHSLPRRQRQKQELAATGTSSAALTPGGEGSTRSALAFPEVDVRAVDRLTRSWRGLLLSSSTTATAAVAIGLLERGGGGVCDVEVVDDFGGNGHGFHIAPDVQPLGYRGTEVGRARGRSSTYDELRQTLSAAAHGIPHDTRDESSGAEMCRASDVAGRWPQTSAQGV